MIDALLTGRLHTPAQARTSKTGKTFVVCRLTVADADQQRQFINVIAFREPVCDALLALDVGDSVAVAGPIKCSTWTDRNGETKISYDLTAENVMSLYSVRKKRDKTQQTDQQDRQPAPAGHGGDDFIDAGQPLDF